MNAASTPLSPALLDEQGGEPILVEFHAEADGKTPYPVEYKRGKAKLHRADEVQLCAQALCLEEMTGRAVPEGALYYAETKRRVIVAFDARLRQLTEDTITQLRDIFVSLKTPPAVYRADRCRARSLLELCRPKAASKPAKQWRDRMLASLLNDAQLDDVEVAPRAAWPAQPRPGSHGRIASGFG